MQPEICRDRLLITQSSKFIIRQIKNELASGLAVAEVAYKLGFEYPALLSRMFKKETGQTPTEYIRSRKKTETDYLPTRRLLRNA